MHRIDLIRLRDKKVVRSAQRTGLHIAVTDAIYPDDTYAYDCEDDAEATNAMGEFKATCDMTAQQRPYDFAVLVRFSAKDAL